MISLIAKSLWNRKGTALLTLFSIAISVALLIGVEQIRKGVRTSFSSAVSGTDLIVGARGGSLQLLLYSVFRMGNAPNNLTWESYQDFKKHSRVSWTIPFSLGDSHHGYRVLGTNHDYFKRFRYGNRQRLKFSEGKPFSGVFHAVLGALFWAALAFGKRAASAPGLMEEVSALAEKQEAAIKVQAMLRAKSVRDEANMRKRRSSVGTADL